MAAIPIAMPSLRAEGPSGNSQTVQKDPVTEANTQAWLAHSFVQTSGTGAAVALQRCASAATAIYGFSVDAAKGTGTAAALLTPPFTLFGLLHYCFDPRDRIFEINATNGSASGANIGATGVTYAGGGTGGVALAVGQQYGILTMTSGTYSGYQTLDVTNTTQKVFEIVALAPGQLTTDNNPRLWVKVIASVIQG